MRQMQKLLVIPFALMLCGCAAKKPEVAATAGPAEVDTTEVVSKRLDRNMNLPGEVLAFQDVPIYPKVTGFIDWIGVDRGSYVKKGQPLVRLIAPELAAQENEAKAKITESESKLAEANRRFQTTQSEKLVAQAKLDADSLTLKRMQEASQTPGVVAQNDVDVLAKQVEGDRQEVSAKQQIINATSAEVASMKSAVKAAKQAEKNIADFKAYLNITAPFDGMISERNMHDGSLAYPPSGVNGYPPMLRIRQMDLMRIVIPVPEVAVSGVEVGTPIDFTVAAFPNQVFTGKVARISHALEIKTRTMPVELNYWNKDGWKIEPGMFPDVRWPMRREYDTMFVPTTSVAVTLEKPFVVRVRGDKVEWVYVKTGQTMGDMIEVFGDLQAGDQVAVRGTDELANGSVVRGKLVSSKI